MQPPTTKSPVRRCDADGTAIYVSANSRLTALALNSCSQTPCRPFPSSAVFANQPRDRDDYERRFAGTQAHNRWMVDFCAAVLGRRKSPVRIFLYDIEDALAEIRWGNDAGMPAVLVPAVSPNHPLEGL